MSCLGQPCLLSWPLRASPVRPPPPRSFEELREGQLLDGKVAVFGETGVLLDIGFDVLARLQCSYEQRKRIWRTDVLRGLRVELVEWESRRVHVSFDGLLDLVEGRLVIEQLRRGQILSGTVVSTALVDVNAERKALILGPRDQVFKLRRNEILEGLRVARVRKGKLDVRLPGLEERVAGRGLLVKDPSG
ncbi:unnamed protein product [Prorocentrum cordatum]|uniref:S1 motif domain-containing protein n=1 Tax=Prorocentrum cordatum TaxID=2364126 RepID=A0ABN9XAN0_9DINO|nr:unnamed protein product [Polarella glacialis]